MLLALLAVSSMLPQAEPSVSWQPLADGVEYARIQAVAKPDFGDGVLHVVRIDPKKADIAPALQSEVGGAPRTAAQWAQQEKLLVTINAGMFQTDYLSNVGYLRNGKHVNNGAWNNYKSALVLGPGARLVDVDSKAAQKEFETFATIIQNLRLIRGERKNVWKQSDKRWSEAAIAADRQGRILFVFLRTPLSMNDFNELLLKLPLEVIRAMHVEGGPEASLSIHAPGLTLDLCGSYETSFNEDDGNTQQWPIPNVLGVRARVPETTR